MNRSIFLFLCVLLVFYGCSGNRSEKEIKKYEIKLQMAAVLIFKSTSACLYACRANVAQWQKALLTDNNIDFKEIASIGKGLHFNKSDIEELIKQLTKPPEKHIKTHQKILEMFDIYLDAISLARKPSGTLESYNEKITDIDDWIEEAKEEFDILYGGGELEEKSGEDEYTEVDVLEDKEPQDPRAARIESLIKQLLEDTNYHNRRQAAFSLGKLKVEKAVDALHQALEDRSWQVHIAAAWALKKITGEDYQMDYKEWKKRYN